jgi:glycine/D-amino acid oxidase-like deaminating enzyme
MAKNEHFDVLIVGAGLSGIGAGYHLQEKCPGKSYVILRGATASAAPGICFAIPASAPTRTCIRSAIRSNRGPSEGDRRRAADPELRLRDRGSTTASTRRSASTTRQARVVVVAGGALDRGSERTVGEGATEVVRFTCGFLFMCSGYYKYEEGYTPEFSGAADFAGQIVHPQKWPEDLDYAGKRVVVIGSGATP